MSCRHRLVDYSEIQWMFPRMTSETKLRFIDFFFTDNPFPLKPGKQQRERFWGSPSNKHLVESGAEKAKPKRRIFFPLCVSLFPFPPLFMLLANLSLLNSTWQWWLVPGNSGKPVALEISSLTKFLRYVFQGQGACDFQESWTCEALESRTRDFREPGTCEALESRTRDFRESWTCEALESRTRDFRESWTCEASESRTRDFRESWTCEASESRTRDFQESWTCKASKSWARGSQESRTSGATNFGGRKIRESARGLFRKSRTGNSRTGRKQSQSCRPKKSGFGVWTSGRLANIWDVKGIRVCVHIWNIPWARGCFRNVEVPWSPYK
jgi:hypothetical protein